MNSVVRTAILEVPIAKNSPKYTVKDCKVKYKIVKKYHSLTKFP